MLGVACYDPAPTPLVPDAPSGLSVTTPLQSHGMRIVRAPHARRPRYSAREKIQGLKMRSSSALPIACVRFTTFSLRRIFCTWFFTVSGLILRIAPISKFDLPR